MVQVASPGHGSTGCLPGSFRHRLGPRLRWHCARIPLCHIGEEHLSGLQEWEVNFACNHHQTKARVHISIVTEKT